MRNLNFIKNEFNSRKQLLINCLRLYRDYQSLGHPNSSPHIRAKSQYSVLSRSADAIFKILILEIFKLFSEKEDYSIFKLLNVLKNNHKNSYWQNRILNSEILSLKDKLLQHKQTIKKVVKYRNLYVAHLDPKRINYSTVIFERKIKKLIIVDGVFVLDEIQKKVFNNPRSLHLHVGNEGLNIYHKLCE